MWHFLDARSCIIYAEKRCFSMKKKIILLMSLGLFGLTSAIAVFATKQKSLGFGAAEPGDYVLTLDSTTKFSNSRGVGTAYTTSYNPIQVEYTTADWSNSNDFVTFNEAGNGRIAVKTAMSGITKIEVVAKNKSSGQFGEFDLTFSVGELLNKSSYNQTVYTKNCDPQYSSYKKYTFIPNDTMICNYFTIEGNKSPLMNTSMSIQSISIYYSCSMSKAALRAESNYSFVNIQIDNEAKNYAEYLLSPTANANISLTYDSDEYDFVDWRYKGSDEVVSTSQSFTYTVDNTRGFHDLEPHFTKRNCINVCSNHPGYGSASFSDGDIDKYAYTGVDYTVVAVLEESDVANGFFPAFAGWYLDGVLKSTELTYTFQVPVEGQAYEMVAKFGLYNETFNQGVRLCYQEEWLGRMVWREETTDTFVRSYDGAFYDFESYVGTISGKGDCQDQSYNPDDLWHQRARGVSALTPYLRLNRNYSKYYKANGQGAQEKVSVKDFDPNKVACIEFYFDRSEANSRDDISISGGATAFALEQKGIADPVDGKLVSRFCLTEFTTDEINISIPDRISDVNFFKLKRVVVHYKIAIN